MSAYRCTLRGRSLKGLLVVTYLLLSISVAEQGTNTDQDGQSDQSQRSGRDLRDVSLYCFAIQLYGRSKARE